MTKRLWECSYRLKTWYLFRYALGCGFANNRLYVVGGYPIQGDTAYSSEIYEFGSQQWRELTSKLLKPRINPGIYLYKGLITLFGTGELGIFSLDAEETKWEFTGDNLSKPFISGSSGPVQCLNALFYAFYWYYHYHFARLLNL